MFNKKQISIFLVLLLVSSLSFAQEKKIPNYSTTERRQVPTEYKWKIEDIYANEDAWRTDYKKVQGLMQDIDKLKKDWTKSAKNMLAMFKLSDNISIITSKLYQYAGHSSNVEMSNSHYQVMKGEVQSLGVELSTKFVFMEEDLLKLEPSVLNKYYQQEKGLEDYKFTIEQTIRNKKYILPSEQEKLVSLTGLFSSNFDEAFNLLNNVDIPNPVVVLANGDSVTLNYSNYSLYRGTKDANDRSNVMRTFWANHKKYENTLAALLDGEMKTHLFNMKSRGYSSTLQAKLFRDDIDTTVYYNLISYVKNNLEPFHRYLKLKKELLGLDTFRYEDIYASSVKSVDKVYTFNESEDIIVNTMQPLGSEYIGALKTAFQNRWIDIYPNKDKESGAYSSGVYGVHPFIKMNFNGEYDALSTLIHELGHSMHSYLSSKYQPYANTGYTIFTAEIASTFNESMLLDNLLKSEKDDLFKLFLLDNYIEGIRGTIYRQTLFAEFELAMHKRVEEGKSLTADWLNEKYLALTREYYGHDKGVTQVDDYIQNEWSSIPHFFMNYYVFQYSTGMIASMALSENILTGKEGSVDKYLTMLKSGGNDFPVSLLKKAGVDMTTKAPYDEAFSRLDKLVTEMENIVKKLKAEGKI